MAKRGETREVILNAAEKVFFANGYEKTSVKMILQEADIVTGSFYHFFSSKEALFEAVVERYLEGYAEKIRKILADETLGIKEILERIMGEFRKTMDTYTDVLQAENLHWTVQYALHDRTLETIAVPLAEALGRLKEQGKIHCDLPVDDRTLAWILLRGSEAIIHDETQKEKRDALMEFWKSILSF